MVAPRQEYICGSSPLARGLLTSDYGMRVNPGIIPARAGFTAQGPGPAGLPADHPRSRGVYLDNEEGEVGFQGSSPLARGLPQRRRSRHCPARIIPARAGFTGTGQRPHAGAADHPRSRGVY